MKHFYFVPQKIHFAENNEAPKEIQLFRVGSFYDERYGKVDITPEHLKKMSENFDSNVRGVDIALDFSHDSEGPAAAWIKKLSLKNGGSELWAEVDWTNRGRDNLLGKEFRYVSPDFTFSYQDNESLKEFGPVLLGAGLTNRPVIKSMAPAIALTEITEGEKMELEEMKKQLAEKDKMLAEQAEKIQAMEKKMQEGDSNMPNEQELLKKISDQSAMIAELQSKLKGFEVEVEMAEKSKKFDVMLSEGKACEAQRDAFLKDDMAGFIEKAQPVKLSEIGSGKNGEEEKPNEDKSASDELVEMATKLSKEKSISFSEAAKVVLKDNKELAQKYREETAV